MRVQQGTKEDELESRQRAPDCRVVNTDLVRAGRDLPDIKVYPATHVIVITPAPHVDMVAIHRGKSLFQQIGFLDGRIRRMVVSVISPRCLECYFRDGGAL